MKPTKIFLDLDDVLNRFTMPALEYVGCPVNPFSYKDYQPKWGWGIVGAANYLQPLAGFTEKLFWESIDYDFWANLPESDECMFLLHSAKSLVGPENVCIISNPSPAEGGLIKDAQISAAKIEWIQMHLPTWLHRQYLIGPRKWFCASPDALLIDDCEYNIREFIATGGRTILVPRPWNWLHGVNAQQHIQDRLCDIFYGCNGGALLHEDKGTSFNIKEIEKHFSGKCSCNCQKATSKEQPWHYDI